MVLNFAQLSLFSATADAIQIGTGLGAFREVICQQGSALFMPEMIDSNAASFFGRVIVRENPLAKWSRSAL